MQSNMPSNRSNRRALFTAAVLLASLSTSACSSEPPGPNVVLVVVDTLRADHLPFYGYEKQTAPYLDSLASRGVVFERAWSTSSWTAPATASIMTGLYPNQHGVTQGMKLVQAMQQEGATTLTLNRIPSAIQTVPKLMKSRGYRTFGITDNPNICKAEGFDGGFDRFRNFDYRNAPAVNRTLANWNDEIKDSAGWFVYLHYMDPHYPYMKREPWYEEPASLRNPGSKSERELGIDELLAVYDSEINSVDHHIRQAFELLEVDEETVVIIVADHGEELMQRSNDLQHEFKLYSELTHVPLVIVHPGAQLTRSRVPHTVSIIDVLPTLRQIIGAPASSVDEGQSLVPYYTSPEELSDDRPVFSMRERLEVLGGQKKWAIIQRDDKLILTENEHGAKAVLYDMGSDWGELNDISKGNLIRVAELKGGLADMREAARQVDPEQVEIVLTEEQEQSLENLGYVEGAETDDESDSKKKKKK